MNPLDGLLADISPYPAYVGGCDGGRSVVVTPSTNVSFLKPLIFVHSQTQEPLGQQYVPIGPQYV